MKLPVMLNKIFLELSMNFSVLYPAMPFKESLDPIWIILWLNRSPIGDVLKVLRHIPLIFNDHVMQYDATSHDFPQNFGAPVRAKATNNSKVLLKHTEGSLHIFRSHFLTLGKVNIFVTFWTWNCFDQCGPQEIDAIRKVVTHRVVVPIDRIVASRGISCNKPSKQW